MTEPTPTPSPQPSPTPEPTPTPTPAAATRPEWLPEAHWDAQANAIKPDFGTHYAELTQFHKAETDRRAALPQKPEDYKIEPKLPEGAKVPDGMKLGDHPLQKQAFGWAHKHGVSPDALSELNGLVVMAQIEERNANTAAFAEETKKLGTDAVARRNAAITWVNGKFTGAQAEELRSLAVTAAGTEVLEAIMAMVAGRVAGHEPPPPPKPAATSMADRWYSPEQKAS